MGNFKNDFKYRTPPRKEKKNLRLLSYSIDESEHIY